MKPPVEIRKNDDGSIDEIIAEGCGLHIEQMTDDGWFIGIQGNDGSYWQFWMGAWNRRALVEVRHTEMMTAEEEKDRRCAMKCLVCDGVGTTPMATPAIALPPRERRELDQAAADNPVKCWRCDGTGQAHIRDGEVRR